MGTNAAPGKGGGQTAPLAICVADRQGRSDQAFG
jgi:hypothetical protein